MRTARWVIALAATVVGCSKDAREVPIDVVTGYEDDAFSQEPAVTRVDIRVTTLDGSVTLSASTKPGGSFDLGELPEDQYVTATVKGLTAEGTTVVRGTTLNGLQLSGIEGALPLFAQRINQWARPPNGLDAAHLDAPAAILGEQYLITTGGTAAKSKDGDVDAAYVDAYDMASFGGAVAGSFPVVARTLISFGELVLAIGDESATFIDYTYGTTFDAQLPDGLESFADVAGGVPVTGTDGLVYVVGATRRQTATRSVLVVSSDGSLAAVDLVRPRLGASAAWIDGVGLAVAGGSEEGQGVELLADGTDTFIERGFPADPTIGAGAVIDVPRGLALIGGSINGMPAPTRRLDPTCLSNCVITEVAAASFPVATVGTRAFAIGGGRVVAVGEEPDSRMMRSFVIELGGTITEAPLREPRFGAAVTPTPVGSLAVLGGFHMDGTPALHIELLMPE